MDRLKVVYWNACGIQHKIIELYNYLLSEHIDVACICETFLKPHIKTKSHPDFLIHRLDREDRPKGGVMIIV